MGSEAGGRLRGPLPSSLRRLSLLSKLLAHHQMLEGDIPDLTSSLEMLILHCSRFSILSDKLLFRGPSKRARRAPIILLHQNLLSCELPRFSGTHIGLSLAAIGNRFWKPDGQYPDWIASFERDDLLWASVREGYVLSFKLLAGAAFFTGASVRKWGGLSWRPLSRWLVTGGSQGVVAQAIVCESSLMMKAMVWGLLFYRGCLWQWDLYSCPGTLVMASACLRESTMVNLIVLFCWTGLCFGSRLGSWLLTCKQQASQPGSGSSLLLPQQFVRNCLLCCSWVPLILMLSALAAVDQTGKSVPGFFNHGAWASKVISLSMGAIQSLIICVLLPWLAKRFIPGMRPLLGLSSLLVTCVVPAIVILHLDDACMAQWTSLWTECSSKRAAQFNIVVSVSSTPVAGHSKMPVLHADDICKPQRQGHRSGCVQVALLRLQDMLLGKWITSGLVMPAVSIVFQRYVRDPMKVVQYVSLAVEVALFTSGPLPLLTPVLLLAMLSKTFFAAISWENGKMREMTLESIGALSWTAAQILSAMLHCAFCHEDAFASSVAVILAAHLLWVALRRRGVASGNEIPRAADSDR